MTPRRPLETLGRLLGRPRAPPGAPGCLRRRALKSTNSILVAPGGSRDPPGRALGPSGPTFGRLGGRFCDPRRPPPKSKKKNSNNFSFVDQFSASRKCYKNLLSMSMFNTRVFDCDIWKHRKSLVRVIEFKLFIVFIFSNVRYRQRLELL